MKELLFGGARLNSAVADFGLFVLRAFAGTSLALAHGLGKLPPTEGFMKGVTALGLPPQAAWLSGFAEFFCGLLLAIGLGTRPAALIVATNMSVAAFRQHATDPYSAGGARVSLPRRRSHVRARRRGTVQRRSGDQEIRARARIEMIVVALLLLQIASAPAAQAQDCSEAELRALGSALELMQQGDDAAMVATIDRSVARVGRKLRSPAPVARSRYSAGSRHASSRPPAVRCRFSAR